MAEFMKDETVKIIGIAGSIRQGSFNRMLLSNMFKLLPEWAEKEIVELNTIPVFNQDLEHDQPAEVTMIKEKVRQADLVIFTTPEYNHSMSGVLKNTLDWLSRPPVHNPFSWKVAAIASASTGAVGGARAQEDLRRTLTSLGAIAVPRPEVMIVNADKKFSQDGILTDPIAKNLIAELLDNSLRLALSVKRALYETLTVFSRA